MNEQEQAIENEFEEIVRVKMTEEQFWKWVSTWYDTESIMETCLNWETLEKAESLGELREIIKNNK